MDEYGFAASARTGMHIFEMSSRQTGRTMRLIERVTEKDRIIVPDERMQRHLLGRLREAGKEKVEVRILKPGADPIANGFGTLPHGRTFFDHTWVQMFFDRAVTQAEESLDYFQKQLSKTWPEKPEIDESAQRISYAGYRDASGEKR